MTKQKIQIKQQFYNKKTLVDLYIKLFLISARLHIVAKLLGLQYVALHLDLNYFIYRVHHLNKILKPFTMYI